MPRRKGQRVVSVQVSKVGSSPDVDSDFNTDVVGKVKEHVAEVYGADNVAEISVFQPLKARSAFKDMCTIYEIPFDVANEVSSLIPKSLTGPVSELFDEDSEFYEEGYEFRKAVDDPMWGPIIEGATSVGNRIKSVSLHACGVVMSSHPLQDSVPMSYNTSAQFPTTQWKYGACESLGLLKMDFLSLDTVNIIQETLNNIMRAGKTPPNMLDIIHGPLDDEKTFETFRSGYTTGVFQFASDGAQDLLRRMQPTSINDIAAATALYRPGPMGMESHIRYADRRSGREGTGHPVDEEFIGTELEDILSPTLNIVTYQEQIINIATSIAGMTLREGDDLRRAMGKKKIEVMEAMKPKFFEGASSRGFSKEAISELWDTIAMFASYGFNKSHAVSYALTAYQACYLKTHFPVEFLSALLTQHMSKKAKVLSYLKEARRLGVKIGTVSINKSQIPVTPAELDEDGKSVSGLDIYYGFSGVKSVSHVVSEAIVSEREDNGDYTSVRDVFERVVPLIERGNVASTFVQLANAGAFDEFGVSRKYVAENVKNFIKSVKSRKEKGNSLFDLMDDDDTEMTDTVGNPDEEYPYSEKVFLEASAIGLYLTEHPMERLMPSGHSSGLVGPTIDQLLKTKKWKKKAYITAAVTSLEHKVRKNGSSIKVAIDDNTGYLEAYVSEKLVLGMSKYKTQQSIKKSYCIGSSVYRQNWKRELDSLDDVVSVPMLEEYKTYIFEVEYRPGNDDFPARAVVTDIRQIQLGDNGRLPLRIRIDESGSKSRLSSNFTGLKQLSSKFSGDDSVFISLYNGKDVSNVIDNDEMFECALEELEEANKQQKALNDKDSKSSVSDGALIAQKSVSVAGEAVTGGKRSTAKKRKNVPRQWPPATYDTVVTESEMDYQTFVEQLHYIKQNKGVEMSGSLLSFLNTKAKFNPDDYDIGFMMEDDSDGDIFSS